MKPTKKFSIYFKKIEFWLVTLILFLASFLRLYRISDYMTFLGDEGRDVLVAKHILEGDFTLLGPRSSAADFFHGPIYYYFMAPFLWLFRLDPVGPAVMVALFGIATVFLVYYIGKKFFNTETALFAASLYAVSPLVISFSRSSWNPNPVPFFSLLTLYLLYKGIGLSSWKYSLISGILLGIALQLHYISVFLGIVVAVFTFLAIFYMRKKVDVLILGRHYFQLFIGFLTGFSMFLAFELRHGFPNTRTIFDFVFSTTLEKNYEQGNFFSIIQNGLFRLFGRLITRYPPPEQISLQDYMTKIDIFYIDLGDFYRTSVQIPVVFVYYITLVLIVLSIAVVGFQFIKVLRQKNKKVLKLILICIWLFLGVLLFGFYKKPIYDYYFGFMFPLPFFLVGNLLSAIYRQRSIRPIGKIVAIVCFVFLLSLNLAGIPFRHLPNRQKEQVKAISDFILKEARSKSFNFALITGGNSDHAYRYFFEIGGNAPKTIENFEKDPNRESVTDQLFIVCESISCAPLGHSLWEIAGFGRATISAEWNVSVVKVYKLNHFQQNTDRSL